MRLRPHESNGTRSTIAAVNSRSGIRHHKFFTHSLAWYGLYSGYLGIEAPWLQKRLAQARPPGFSC